MASGCGTIIRTVTSENRDPKFKPHHKIIIKKTNITCLSLGRIQLSRKMHYAENSMYKTPKT